MAGRAPGEGRGRGDRLSRSLHPSPQPPSTQGAHTRDPLLLPGSQQPQRWTRGLWMLRSFRRHSGRQEGKRQPRSQEVAGIKVGRAFGGPRWLEFPLQHSPGPLVTTVPNTPRTRPGRQLTQLIPREARRGGAAPWCPPPAPSSHLEKGLAHTCAA